MPVIAIKRIHSVHLGRVFCFFFFCTHNRHKVFICRGQWPERAVQSVHNNNKIIRWEFTTTTTESVPFFLTFRCFGFKSTHRGFLGCCCFCCNYTYKRNWSNCSGQISVIMKLNREIRILLFFHRDPPKKKRWLRLYLRYIDFYINQAQYSPSSAVIISRSIIKCRFGHPTEQRVYCVAN